MQMQPPGYPRIFSPSRISLQNANNNGNLPTSTTPFANERADEKSVINRESTALPSESPEKVHW